METVERRVRFRQKLHASSVIESRRDTCLMIMDNEAGDIRIILPALPIVDPKVGDFSIDLVSQSAWWTRAPYDHGTISVIHHLDLAAAGTFPDCDGKHMVRRPRRRWVEDIVRSERTQSVIHRQ